jgi:hypothetical protein
MNKKATQTLIEPEVISNWQPKWVIATQVGSEMGVTIDDHCFVVLSPNGQGQWQSVKHIPKRVALRLGELANQGELDY